MDEEEKTLGWSMVTESGLNLSRFLMDGSRSEDGLMARAKLVRWKEQGLREEVWLASEGSLTFKTPFESAVSVWLDE